MGITDNLNTIRNARKAVFHLTMLASFVAALSPTGANRPPAERPSSLDNHIQELPFCGDRHEHTIGRRLLYVTTLDGRLSALDITRGGKLRWSIPTGPGPLISSSIHRLELTNDGHFVRMIPSLSGGIYKFDGESIDPIPINSDHLLSSSTKFTDELVISGGKETRTYGVSARTGQLLYECSMNGCINSTDAAATTTPSDDGGTDDRGSDENGEYFREHDPLVDDVIVVRRQTQTVRAVESRTGAERWNFSVAEHDLDLLKPVDCHERKYSELDMAVLDLAIKVIVPEGIVCAFSKSDANTMLWKYKFDHPIVSAWKIGPSDELESIDLFGSAQWLWEQDGRTFRPFDTTVGPSIYLGMYDKQLYIQESMRIRREIVDNTNLYHELIERELNMPKIPWRPIAAGSNSLVVADDNHIVGSATGPNHDAKNNILQGNELMPYDEDMFALSAQSVLNASEYVNGSGFYFYTGSDLNKTNEKTLYSSETVNSTPSSIKEGTNASNITLEDEFSLNLDDIDAPVKVVILSLWFWWREILVIAFTSAVLLNLLIGKRSRLDREIVVIERHIPVPTAMEATESSTTVLLGPVTNSTKNGSNGNSGPHGQRSVSESTSHSGSDQFSSRFQTDFDLLRCLGRGGFGVVFEAKNKLDDCKYAVKRITLPNKKESRERVMREVKTLANCEHYNIVRYFQAWVENPPSGWQEEEDSKWLAQEMSSTSIQIETPTDGSNPPSFPDIVSQAEDIKMAKKKLLMSWVSSVTSTACSNDPNFNENESQDDKSKYDEDSCVIFRSESQSLALQEGDKVDVSEDVQNTTTTDPTRERCRLSNATAISIDINSSSYDSCIKAGDHFDHTHLSDSFQIEFVRATADGDESSGNTDVDDNIVFLPTDEGTFEKRSPANLSLDLATPPEPTNNGKQIPLPVSSMHQKSAQNKVYLYIQMQLCRKESLRDWLRDNRLDARAAHIGRIFYQIVDAVEYVHLKGLIHRDLKPSNIFFSQDGQIKIGDFGLVTDMSDIPNLVNKCGDKTGLPSCARHTQQVGTHLYMSPEQLRGQHYDYKVDIYSLGLIFFELLFYFGTEMERIVTLRDLRDGRFPKDFSVKHPGEYELLKQMLSAQPAERPATSELKQRLNGILKLPDLIGDADSIMSLSGAVRRLSCSRS